MSDASDSKSIAEMYRDGVSLHTLGKAFGLDERAVVEVLREEGVVEPEAGEDSESFVRRVLEDVKHAP